MNTNNGHTRLFFALLPDAQTRADIDFHVNQLATGNGRKVRPENYHLTLAFLGNVSAAQCDALCLDCDNLRLPSFSLAIDTPGWWRKAGIFWLGPHTSPVALVTLHDHLHRLASRRGLALARQPFVPHITLMRHVQTAPQYPVIRPFTWQADGFSLMQSNTHPEGVKYSEVAYWPLQS